MTRHLIALILLLLPLSITAQETDAVSDTHLWAAIRDGGHAVLLRHALAPGTGDPSAFRLDDCTTQRLLSDAGRDQARALGALFRRHGIDTIRIYSSQWCRCLETGQLLGLGPVEPHPALNSFFQDRSRRDTQLRAMDSLIATIDRGESAILVTHQVNITSLTGGWVNSGEAVVVRRDATGTIIEVGRFSVAADN